jgi:hypothetical protein
VSPSRRAHGKEKGHRGKRHPFRRIGADHVHLQGNRLKVSVLFW